MEDNYVFDYGSNSSCVPPFTKKHIRILLLVYGSIGGGTVFVCVFGIATVFYLRLHRIFVYRLAMYQVIAACFFGLTRALQLISLGNLDEQGDIKACQAVAYLVVCSSWIKLVLTFWVTVHLFVFTVFLKNLRRLEVFYVATAVIAGPVIAAIPLITKSYGHAGPWCWIEGRKKQCNIHKFATGEIEQIAVWYGPALVVLLVESVLVLATIAVSIFRISCKAWSGEHQSLVHAALNRQRQALHLLLPLLAYPTLFCVLITIPLVNRIYEIAEASPNFGLFMASAVSIPVMGLAAGIALLAHIAFIKRHVFPQIINLNHFRPSIQTERSQQEGGASSQSCISGRPKRSTSPSYITKYVAVRESEIDGTQTDEELSLPYNNT